MYVRVITSDKRAREKPCLRCGYSLRKNLDARYCPECGLSVWLSLNSNDGLDISNPVWLRKLSLATLLLAAAQMIGISFWVALGPAANYLIQHASPRQWAIILLVGSLHLFAYSASLILFATPERRYPDRFKPYRYGAIGVSAFGMLGALVLAVGAFGSAPPGGLPLLNFPLRLILLAQAAATFAYLRQLARRIPRTLLVRICGYLLLLPLVSAVLALPWFFYFFFFGFWRVLEYLIWAYIPISIGMLIWFAALFRRSAKTADAAWAAETAQSRSEPVAQA